jgi:nicotinate-nucleotide--dimethylbenzimidazole phosphoribosyltransferase
MKLPTIPKIDSSLEAAAWKRQDSLTKPPRSLGRLEEIGVRLAAISGKINPPVARKAVIVMAADHGVTAEGVSAYPSAVTPQMVLNFLRGGAAINVLARQAGARVAVVDIGVASDLSPHPQLFQRKIMAGTANFAKGPAMSRAQAEASIAAGIEIFELLYRDGLDLLATGDMGIGNTTASAAIVSAICGKSPQVDTGRGTGVDDAGLARKVAVIERALSLNKPDSRDAIDVLSKVGGLEIGGLAGAVIAAAAHRVPVVIDGFISGAAALIAAELSPEIKPYLFAAHLSVEAGHRTILDRLGLKPLLDLNLRLGEGTGAVLAFHLLEAASRLMAEMATFGEAGVSEKS